MPLYLMFRDSGLWLPINSLIVHNINSRFLSNDHKCLNDKENIYTLSTSNLSYKLCYYAVQEFFKISAKSHHKILVHHQNYLYFYYHYILWLQVNQQAINSLVVTQINNQIWNPSN